MYNLPKIRKDFPSLSEKINGKDNSFLDSAASAQKPSCVLELMNNVYSKQYANVNRGSYLLSENATYMHEQARVIIQKFINAKSEKEIVFTRNATESINLVVSSWGRKFLKSGDEVLISEAEHHANLVPWQILRDEIGFELKIFKIADDGRFVWEEFTKLLNDNTKFVSVTGMSNVLGTTFPVKKIISEAHKFGAKVLIDACQLAVHKAVDVQDLDCDFLAFSGHKLYGPTGIGVLYGKYDILDSMPPYQSGGDMVVKVGYDKATYSLPPARFEAGTPAIVEAIGLGRALEYMQNLGLDNIEQHEHSLSKYAIEELSKIDGYISVGDISQKNGVFSFVIDGVHSQDLAFILNKEGVSIRVGHHCAEPLIHRLGFESVARASFGLYTNFEDIDKLVLAIKKAKTFF